MVWNLARRPGAGVGWAVLLFGGLQLACSSDTGGGGAAGGTGGEPAHDASAGAEDAGPDENDAETPPEADAETPPEPDADTPPEPDAGDPTPRIDWWAAGEPPVAAPQIPWLEAGRPDRPVLPCPENWRPVVGADGLSTCEPWPESGRQDCAAPWEVHLPGEPGCRAVGAACPEAGFPADLPESGVWYVQPDAVGGDGSLGAPFATIAEALAVAVDGDTIALSEGTHPGVFEAGAEVTIRGVCAERTIIARGAVEGDPVPIMLNAARSTLRDVTLTGGVGPGIELTNGERLTAQGVAIHDLDGIGIDVADHGIFAGEDIVVSDVRPLNGLVGIGIRLSGPGSHLGHIEVRAVSGIGVVLMTNAGLQAADMSIHDISAGDDATWGTCIGLSTATGAVVERTACQRTAWHGVSVSDRGQATFRDCVFRDLGNGGSQACGLRITGANVGNLPRLTAERVLIERPGACGVLADRFRPLFERPEVHLTDVVIRDLGGTADLADVGIQSKGAAMWMERVSVTNAHDRAFMGSDDTIVVASHLDLEAIGTTGLSLVGGTYTLSDVAIHRGPTTEPEADAFGLLAGNDAHLQVDRLLIEQVPGLGIVLSGNSGVVDGALRDVIVRDMVPGPADTWGNGVDLSRDAGPLTFERLLVENVLNVGVAVAGGVEATFRDLRVSGVQSDRQSGQYGDGLYIGGASATVERAVIADAKQSGLNVTGDPGFDGVVSLTDVAVTGVEPQACVELGTCPQTDAASGVYVKDAPVTLTRVTVKQAKVALQSYKGTLEGSDVIASECPVGLNLQAGATSELVRVDLTGCDAASSDDALAVPTE